MRFISCSRNWSEGLHIIFLKSTFSERNLIHFSYFQISDALFKASQKYVSSGAFIKDNFLC